MKHAHYPARMHQVRCGLLLRQTITDAGLATKS